MLLKRFRRGRLRKLGIPPEWRRYLERNFVHYGLLPPRDLEELTGHIRVFLAEKVFFGRGGIEVTDEIRVTVAAYASLLLLRRETDYFPRMRTVVVYPTEYLAPYREVDRFGIEVEGYQVRSGEAWEKGPVVLSWEAVLRDSWGARRCRHVVIHEFAHQLDYENGYSDGVPALGKGISVEEWRRVMETELRALRRVEAMGRATVLDRYGAQGPGEFFAVATEAFFMCPAKLSQRRPELYRLLSRYFNQDPASDWHLEGDDSP